MSPTDKNGFSATFIPYNVDKAVTKSSKRKRDVIKYDKQNKKSIKSAKGATGNKVCSKEESTPVTEIWIGASVNEKQGTFCIYYDENDYKTQVFTRENEYQNIDYTYALGTLKAIESLSQSTSRVLISVSSRELHRAVFNGLLLEYNELVEKIRNIIRSKQEITLRSVSCRTASSQQKQAIKIACTTLMTQDKVSALGVGDTMIEETIEKENDTIKDGSSISAVNTTEKIVSEKVTVNVISSVDTNDSVKEIVETQKIQEAVEEDTTMNPSSQLIVETTVETAVGTKAPAKVTEVEKDIEPMEQVEEKLQDSTTSWYGFKSIVNMISSRFQNRKSL